MRHMLIPRITELWEPFNFTRDFREEVNRLLDRSLAAGRHAENEKSFFGPSVDVKDEKDCLIVRADIPGIKKEDLSITVEGNQLVLKGERKESQEKKEKDYFFSERFEGSFMRTIELPSKVKPDAVKATYKDGVLEVALPKDESARPKEVKVQIQ